jgi:SAM-dependent methyltransferase
MVTMSRHESPPALPARYAGGWREPFYARARMALVPGADVLDVGAGARPVFAPDERPPGVRYVGLDISAGELARAGALAYDERHVADIVTRYPRLEDRFDLIVSWQTLEHVRSLGDTLENLRAYLRPGGLLVAQLSGGFAVYALVSRMLPFAVAQRLSRRLLGRDPATMFPTYYDRCHYRALRELLAPWTEAEIVPRYAGAGYFEFSRTIRSLYLAYENWTYGRGYRSLATHYLIAARR